MAKGSKRPESYLEMTDIGSVAGGQVVNSFKNLEQDLEMNPELE